MTIAEQLIAVRGALATWAQGHRGTAEIAGDPYHLFALLAAKPGAVRACLFLRDEVKRGEHEEGGVVDRTFMVVVSRGRGFTREAAESLYKGAGDGAPLFDLVEEVRDLVRGFEFQENWTEKYPDYKRFDLFPAPEGMVVDAYQLEFSIGCQLDEAGSSDLAEGIGETIGVG